MPAVVGRVASLHRFPVKSMLGEDADVLDLDSRGVVGDRRWAVRTPEGKLGSGKTTRRFSAVPGLLSLRARTVGTEVLVRLPDGSEYAVDAPELASALSRHLGRPVALTAESDVSHFDDGPVSLLGRGSVDALAAYRHEPVEPARFRANVVIDGVAAFAEDGWVDRTVEIGSATLRVTMPSPRCVMVDMATADLPAQPGNLLAVGALNGAVTGVIASVVGAGRIVVGDEVRLVDAALPTPGPTLQP